MSTRHVRDLFARACSVSVTGTALILVGVLVAVIGLLFAGWLSLSAALAPPPAGPTPAQGHSAAAFGLVVACCGAVPASIGVLLVTSRL